MKMSSTLASEDALLNFYARIRPWKAPRLGFLMLMAAALGYSLPAEANWTLNLGYHNPLNSKIGVNFLYWGSQWNFEAGIGWLDADAEADDDAGEADKDDDKVSVQAAGDIDVKYRFGSGGIAPYVQLGIGAGTGVEVGDDTGGGVGLGGPFVGAGLFFGKPNFYGYAALNLLTESKNTEVQAGLGFDI